MLLIYTPHITNRLHYIFSLFFEEVIPTKYAVTDNLEEFNSSSLAKLNYSREAAVNCTSITPHAILFETNIKPQNICFDEDNANEFDPFAAAFYLVSRYEEYLPFAADEHGRFTANQSTAYELGFLHQPMVNIWAIELKKQLLAKHPHLQFTQRHYTFTPTYDVDAAFCYQGKGIYRTLGGYIRSMLKGNFKEVAIRFKVINGQLKDPHNTFSYIVNQHKAHGIRNPIFFWHLGVFGRFDKNINPKNTAFQNIVVQMAKEGAMGIHPSYSSNNNPKQLSSEIALLNNMVQQKTTLCRQHFLMLKLPQTYNMLAAQGIKQDYTMGYASEPGFRASIAQSFLFFDLSNDKATHLRVHPFAVMDATYIYYKKCTPKDALSSMKDIVKTVKEVNGDLISIWHNPSISDYMEFKGWRTVFDEFLKLAK